MDEKEVHWGLKSPEIEDDVSTDTLQIFVGVGDPEEQDTGWDIPDDDPFDDFDDIDDELPSPMILSLNPAVLVEEERKPQRSKYRLVSTTSDSGNSSR